MLRSYAPNQIVMVQLGAPFPYVVARVRDQPRRRPGGDVLVEVLGPLTHHGTFKAYEPSRLFRMRNVDLVSPLRMSPWA